MALSGRRVWKKLNWREKPGEYKKKGVRNLKSTNPEFNGLLVCALLCNRCTFTSPSAMDE